MKKNLIKVFTLAAVALSLLSATAMASYSDVPDTHPDASAINMLSALGIINGYDDGSFRPEEEVTRAEMAALTIKAMNFQNAEKNLTEKFTDVSLKHWAAGYIATAADHQIINGIGDGSFAPDAPVTYAQASKMLVVLCGYENWAQQKGGYPSGYMLYANQLGITQGVSDVTNDTVLTRANCVGMIYNAINAPMLLQTAMTTNYLGEFVAVFRQMNGVTAEQSPYTSILTRKWGIYPVRGTVTKADSKAGTITYTIEKANSYLGKPYGNSLAYSEESTEAVISTNINASAYINKYTNALIKEKGDDMPELIYIEEAASEK